MIDKFVEFSKRLIDMNFYFDNTVIRPTEFDVFKQAFLNVRNSNKTKGQREKILRLLDDDIQSTQICNQANCFIKNEITFG